MPAHIHRKASVGPCPHDVGEGTVGGGGVGSATGLAGEDQEDAVLVVSDRQRGAGKKAKIKEISENTSMRSQ
jgi:hypothetical protein